MGKLRALTKITRSGLWSDGEFLCHLIAERFEAIATWFHRLGGRCYRNGVAAKQRRATPSDPAAGTERGRGGDGEGT